jgi:glutathione synthase
VPSAIPRRSPSRNSNHTRLQKDKKEFVKKQGVHIIIKPLRGSGEQGLFLLRDDNLGNLNQMIEAVSRDGRVVVQEYLEAAGEGDVRLFIMNDQPLRHKGHDAAFHRRHVPNDLRSSIRGGGDKAPASVDHVAPHMAAIVGPKLAEDGTFLIGLDIVGCKLLEIDVFSPAGLGSARQFERADSAVGVSEALERKVQSMGFCQRLFPAG